MNFGDHYKDSTANLYERNNLDEATLPYQVDGIGQITAVYIHSDHKYAAADWDLEYIDVEEIVDDQQHRQNLRFLVNECIDDKDDHSYTNGSAILSADNPINSTVFQSGQLTSLQSSTKAYLIPITKMVTITSDLMELIRDRGLSVTFERVDGNRILYDVTLDGTKMDNTEELTLGGVYSLQANGAVWDLAANRVLPAGSSLRMYLNSAGFTEDDTIYVYQKDAAGNWVRSAMTLGSGNVIYPLAYTGQNTLLFSRMASLTAAATPAPTATAKPTHSSIPQTGDTFPVTAVVILHCASAVGGIALLLARKRKHGQD